VHYPIPLYRQPAMQQDITLPHADAAAAEVMSLPFHPYLTDEDMVRITSALKDAVGPR
jgi:UDP-2-acetamido-2-deoxy-ribo-hexuluronate aminotransferase